MGGFKVTYFGWLEVRDDMSANFGGKLEGIAVCPIKSGPRWWWCSWLRFLREARGAIVWLHLPTGVAVYPVSTVLRQLCDLLLVYNGVDVVGFSEQPQYRKMVFGRLYIRNALESFIGMADLVVARGRKLRIDAQKLNPTVVETIPIGRMESSEAFSQKKRETEVTILFLGRLLEEKGVFDFISICERLLNSSYGSALRFAIVGDGPASVGVTKSVEQSSNPSRFKHYGWVDDREAMESIWMDSHILVVPSRSFPEGVPRVIDEAIARRVLVVATKVGGIEIEFQNGEIELCEPGDLLGLEEAVKRLLEDGEARRSAEVAGRRRFKRWLAFECSAARQHLDLILRCSKSRDRKRVV